MVEVRVCELDLHIRITLVANAISFRRWTEIRKTFQSDRDPHVQNEVSWDEWKTGLVQQSTEPYPPDNPVPNIPGMNK